MRCSSGEAKPEDHPSRPEMSLHVHPVLTGRPLFLMEMQNVGNVTSKGTGKSEAGISMDFLSETIFSPSVELN